MAKKIINQPSTLFTIACMYFVADQLLPVIQYASSVYVNIFMVLIILGTVFSNNNKKAFTFFLPFLLIFLLQIIADLSRADSLRTIVLSFYSAMLLIVPLVLSFFLISNNYRNTIKIISFEIIILLFITSITTIYGLTTNPLAAKEMATGMHNDTALLMMYYKKNLAGFGITYMVPIIIPMIFALNKTNKLNLLYMAIIILPMIYFVNLTQYAIALISLIIALSSIIFVRNYSFKKFVLLGIGIALFYVFLRPVIGNIFYYIAANNASVEITVRMNALGDIMTGIGSTKDALTMRQASYNSSIDAFFSSPIVGDFFIPGAKKAGGHSFILDYPASFGIAGILALFLTYRQIFRFFYTPFKSQRYYGFMLWSFFLSIFLASVNTSANFFAIGLFAPLIAYILQNKRYIAKSKGGELISPEMVIRKVPSNQKPNLFQ